MADTNTHASTDEQPEIELPPIPVDPSGAGMSPAPDTLVEPAAKDGETSAVKRKRLAYLESLIAHMPQKRIDPSQPSMKELRRVPLYTKFFGLLCFFDGVVTLPIMGLLYGLIAIAFLEDPSFSMIGTDITLTATVTVVGAIIEFVSAVSMIIFGWTLFKSYRRDAARLSNGLIALTVGQILVSIMLQGYDFQLVLPCIQLTILIIISTTVDPSLREERELQQKLRDLVDREAAKEGVLGRDLSGEGYIKLNFFNLFWVFMVCCVLGLIIEIIFHMVVVDPGVYQDRAGLLFGPFSPIYGFGAVLLTIALNRFYDKNFLIVFLVSAVIGATFEAAVSWWMQTSFGAIAWDYPFELLPGVPDPVAVLFAGRTSLPFAAMWGVLGVVWIKICLPRLLAFINLIPWKMRYSLTAIVTALMVVNGAMTLGALDCWFTRVSGLEPSSPVEEFFAEHFDNEYMENRFQSMSIHPQSTSRVETPVG